MPKLTDENIAQIRRLNEIATDIRVGKITLEQGEAEVQSILDDFTAQDGIPSRAVPYDTIHEPSDGVDE